MSSLKLDIVSGFGQPESLRRIYLKINCLIMYPLSAQGAKKLITKMELETDNYKEALKRDFNLCTSE